MCAGDDDGGDGDLDENEMGQERREESDLRTRWERI